jgi:diguanylate cyclase (GGDEF)-like protein
VDQIWKGLLFVALVGAPISVSRATVTGWLPLYSLQIVLALFAIVFVVFLKKIPFRMKSGTLLVLLWAVGLPGILTFGVVATSIWWLVLSCVIASIVISVRAGAVLAVALGLFLGIAAYGFVSGMLTYSMDITDYLTRPVAWLTVMIAGGVFIFIVMQSIGTYNRSIVSLLQEVNNQRDQIQHLAMHDALTGLPVKRLAEDRIRVAFHSARRRYRKVALLFIDLDRFKEVNDTYSHEAGDRVLREVAERLTGAIRGEDTAARIGGDEFLVILSDLSDIDAATQSAERIIQDISMPIFYKTHAITVGASIGISLFPDHSDEMQILLKTADEAMYRIKKSGKNGYAVGRVSSR